MSHYSTIQRVVEGKKAEGWNNADTRSDAATRDSSLPRPTSRKLAPANQAGVLGRLADWKDAPGFPMVHTQERPDVNVRRIP